MNRYLKSTLLAAIALPMVGSSCYSQHSVKTQKKATASHPTSSYLPQECNRACLRLVKDLSGRKNQFGNPIYLLEAYLNANKQYNLDTVSGRANTQDLDRHKSGTEAPLPEGNYWISSTTVSGTIPEVGGRFLAVEPRFKTGRTALGIHYDPSFEKDKKEDGTSGCIGLTTKADRDKIFSFVKQYKPQLLIVNIK
ncbi:MAG: L,D-transpeptidase [Xenococcaceae cyanobacterium]